MFLHVPSKNAHGLLGTHANGSAVFKLLGLIQLALSTYVPPVNLKIIRCLDDRDQRVDMVLHLDTLCGLYHR